MSYTWIYPGSPQKSGCIYHRKILDGLKGEMHTRSVGLSSVQGSHNKNRRLPYGICAVCAPLCLTLWDPMDCTKSGSSVHGLFQARKLEWGARPSSRGSSQPRDRTCIFFISCGGRRILWHRGIWKELWWCYKPKTLIAEEFMATSTKRLQHKQVHTLLES